MTSLSSIGSLRGGAKPGSSSLCYMYICHNPKGQITVSRATSWWPTSKSAEASLGYKFFHRSHLMPVGNNSIHRSGPDSFYPGLLLCTQCPAKTNGDSNSPDALNILLKSSLCCLPSHPRPPVRRTGCFHCWHPHPSFWLLPP